MRANKANNVKMPNANSDQELPGFGNEIQETNFDKLTLGPSRVINCLAAFSGAGFCPGLWD